jgi:hypothetical protein
MRKILDSYRNRPAVRASALALLLYLSPILLYKFLKKKKRK